MRRQLAVVAGVAVLGVGLLGLWRWAPWSEDQTVPSCGDVAAALPEAVPGSWTVTQVQPRREAVRSVVRCEFAFTAADQSYRGEAIISLSEGADIETLRRRVSDSPCYGEAVPYPGADRYEAAKSCAETINAKAFTRVFLASPSRYGHIVVSLTGPDRPDTGVVSSTTVTAQRIADLTMTLTASE
ncbi:hypothetical protein AB0875_26500 [Micromonospora gifhornensis]|uniref:hypothetical protein n=1 Tax=Micromonospora gifhornensis TaxID=84594 RepID=UPI001EF39449|nr:hypothetical protein [Micromonospora gifhornensis]